MTATQHILDVAEMGNKTKDELLDMAQGVGLADGSGLINLRREELLSRLFQFASSQQSLVASGILEVMDEGYGFLRQVDPLTSGGDVYISQSQIRRFGLRTGDTVSGQVRPPKEGERYFGLVRVEKANGLEFGLAAYAFTSSTARATEVSERLETGLVGVNHCAISFAETPFGGVKESGYGHEGGIEGLDAYLTSKFVTQMNA